MSSAELCRQLLSRHGVLVSQARTDWMGDVPLPEPIARFYEEIGPEDVSVPADEGEPYFFPRLTSLWDVQAGYRFHKLTGRPLPEWNDDWLVIVDRPGDPLVFSRSTGRILRIDGSEAYPDLFAMTAALVRN